MLKEKATVLRRINVAIDLFITALSFILAFLVRTNLELNLFLPLGPFLNCLWLLLIIIPLWRYSLLYSGVYGSQRTDTIFDTCGKVTKAIAVGGIILIAFVFIFEPETIDRLLIVLFLGINEVLLLTEKIVVRWILRIARRKGYNYRNILIVGTGKRAREFAEVVNENKKWGLKITGFVDKEESMVGQEVAGIKVIGVIKNLYDILHNSDIAEVVFIVPRKWLIDLEETVLMCEEMGIKAMLAGDIFSHKIARTHLQEFNGQYFLTFTLPPYNQEELIIKRIIDVTLSVLALLLIWPFLLLIAVGIKLTSEGAVLFRQVRCGQNGEKFTIFKFRTMVNEAEGLQSQLQHMNEMDGPVFKIKSDPRVTKFGRFLRQTSLDELPQLINVIKGDMSLVGPRPPLASEVEKYDRWQRRKLSMKPGLTCLWQVCGRNKIGFEKWMQLDLDYIDTWSLLLDIKILLKTIPVILKGAGE